MSNALQDKTAVILGGTSGMGLASAKRFLAEGARVIITGRKQEKIDAAQQELQGDFAIYQADIADYEATKAAIEQGVKRFGKIDVLYQVAGMASMVPFEMADPAHYETMINVDLVSPIVALLNARPHLNDGASIILTTTTASTRPGPPASAYGAAKAGLDQFAKVLALELAHRKIRVNVISPGPIDTPIFNELGIPEEQLSGFTEFLKTNHPVGPPGPRRRDRQRGAVPGERRVVLRLRSYPASRWWFESELPQDARLAIAWGAQRRAAHNDFAFPGAPVIATVRSRESRSRMPKRQRSGELTAAFGPSVGDPSKRRGPNRDHDARRDVLFGL